METIIFGDGNLGRAIGAALFAQGRPHRILGRPGPGGHPAAGLAASRVAVAYEASRAEAVGSNVAAALGAGCRRFVIGTTGWDADRPAVDAMLREAGASAVVAPNFSLGVVAFLRLTEIAAELFGRLEAFDPYVVEWHRRSKPDRPSGTAREIARRIVAAHPVKRRVAEPGASGPPMNDELEVVAIRAGSSPGMHLVGFDSPGETAEFRLTVRDRSVYAAGALAAADWLAAEPRVPGCHEFDAVAAGLLGLAAPSEPADGHRHPHRHPLPSPITAQADPAATAGA